MTEKELRKAMEYLLNNPDKSLGSTFHDASSCYKLIEFLIKELRSIKQINEKR